MLFNDLEDEIMESVAIARSFKYQFDDAINVLLPWNNEDNSIDESDPDKYDDIYESIMNSIPDTN